MGLPRFSVRGSISLFALAISLVSLRVGAQEAAKPVPRQIALTIAQNVPPGFEDIDQTVDAIDEALTVYKRAMTDGVEKYLVGRPSNPVYRTYNPRPAA